MCHGCSRAPGENILLYTAVFWLVFRKEAFIASVVVLFLHPFVRSFARSLACLLGRAPTPLTWPVITPPQVWSLDVNASCTRLVTGASDNQLRVWSLGDQQKEGGGDDAAAEAMVVDGDDKEEEKKSGGGGGGSGGAAAGVEEEEDVVAVYMGSVVRQGNGESATSDDIAKRL